MTRDEFFERLRRHLGELTADEATFFMNLLLSSAEAIAYQMQTRRQKSTRQTSCEACEKPMPFRRTTKRFCSAACRQRMLRQNSQNSVDA